MQVKGIAAALTMDSRGFAVLAAQFRPARLNGAGVCLYCETRWCTEARCVDTHAASLWAPCPRCDGFSFGSCDNCLNGVVEVDRAGLIELADRVLPARPDEAESYAVAGDHRAYVLLDDDAARAELAGEALGKAGQAVAVAVA
ncbi:hypothetical protein ACIBBG_34460 [Micromonospora chersina]|uniref:hypothetical protein n=1 Tax=Micromonospora chersina TaxID=47854 RepID=UPI0037B93F26